MSTTAYVDPHANGTNNWGVGSYTNVDDAVRQPTVPTTSPSSSERIYANAGGSLVNELKFTIPYTSTARVTDIKIWKYVSVAGSVATTASFTLAGSTIEHQSTSGSTGWVSYNFSKLGLLLNGSKQVVVTLTGPATLGKADTEDEYSAWYVEYTYEDTSAEDQCYTAAGTDLANESNAGLVTRNPNTTINIDGASEYVAAWFQVVYLEQGETVTSAKVMFTPASDTAGTAIIKCDDADAPAALTIANADISGRTLTTASKTITDLVSGVPTLVDVTAIVQEVVNRAGWVTGNSLVFVIEGQSPTADDFNVDMTQVFTLCLDHPLPIPSSDPHPNNASGPNTAFLMFVN